MPIAVDSDTLNGALNIHEGNIEQVPNVEGHDQPQRALAGSGETGNFTPLELFGAYLNYHAVRNITSDSRLSPECYPCEELESNPEPECTSLFLADNSLLTETTSSIQAARPPDAKYPMTDIFKVEANTPLLGKTIYTWVICFLLIVYRRV